MDAGSYHRISGRYHQLAFLHYFQEIQLLNIVRSKILVGAKSQPGFLDHVTLHMHARLPRDLKTM